MCYGRGVAGHNVGLHQGASMRPVNQERDQRVRVKHRIRLFRVVHLLLFIFGKGQQQTVLCAFF